MPGGLLAKNALQPLIIFLKIFCFFSMSPRTIFRHPDICFFPPPLGPISGAAVASSPHPRSTFPRHPSWPHPAPARLHAGVPMMAQTIAPRARNCSSCQIFLEDSWDEFCKWVDEWLERPLIIYCVSATSHINNKFNFTLQHENNCSKSSMLGKFPWKPKQTQWSNFLEILFSLVGVIS